MQTEVGDSVDVEVIGEILIGDLVGAFIGALVKGLEVGCGAGPESSNVLQLKLAGESLEIVSSIHLYLVLRREYPSWLP